MEVRGFLSGKTKSEKALEVQDLHTSDLLALTLPLSFPLAFDICCCLHLLQ